MIGLVFDGEKAEIRDDLDVRAPGPIEVKVRLVAAGLCHSDISVINGTIPWNYPCVLGHEGAGIVEAVGEAVTNVRPGDHVVLHTMAFCGLCEYCVTGQPARCRRSMGNASQPFTLKGEPCWNFAGASFFSEYAVVQNNQCVKIDDDIDLSVACLIGCGVLTGIGSVWNRTDLGLGDTCAVIGVGGVGLNVIQGARAKGARRIIAIDTLPEKESFARSLGATDFILGGPGVDLPAEVRKLLPYDGPSTNLENSGPFMAGGVDYAFECVGHPRLLEASLEMLDWGGTSVAVGVPGPNETVQVRVGLLTHVERTLTGSRAGSHRPQHDIPLIVDMYQQGIIKLDELVSARYPLTEWERAADDLHHGKLARGVLQISQQ
ncbi:MAG: Zn-dependent alcohol dehydrogenase [Actinomycetes bacterium]